MIERSRNKGTVRSQHYFGAANFRKRSVPEVRGMEEVAMKLIFSRVNNIMVYVHVTTTEPCDPLRYLRGFSARPLQKWKSTGGLTQQGFTFCCVGRVIPLYSTVLKSTNTDYKRAGQYTRTLSLFDPYSYLKVPHSDAGIHRDKL